jgi:hypothetical protein
LSFGREAASRAAGHPISIIKTGASGTSLYYHWIPAGHWPAVSPGNLFYLWTSRVAVVEPQAPSCVVAVFGAVDAINSNSANAFSANMTTVIQTFRAQHAEWSNVPWVLLQLHINDTMSYRDVVRAQQAHVAATVPGVSIVSLDDLDVGNGHYPAPSLDAGGTRLADACLAAMGF